MREPDAKPFADAVTRTVTVGEAALVYRELGLARDSAPPLVALTHLGANLDSWDPEVVDPLAEDRRVILLGYRGVGGSSGAVRRTFDEMADDAIEAIRTLGHDRVDLLGLSMGGMVAQAIIARAPELVDRAILASSGPQGGSGLTEMTGIMIRSILRGLATATPPTTLLFFTRSPSGRAAASAYQARLRRRGTERDRPVALAVLRAQLSAVRRWGREQPQGPSGFSGPVRIVHGDSDRMVPVANADSLLARFPQATARIFPDAGHGVVSQHRREVVDLARDFLRR